MVAKKTYHTLPQLHSWCDFNMSNAGHGNAIFLSVSLNYCCKHKCHVFQMMTKFSGFLMFTLRIWWKAMDGKSK